MNKRGGVASSDHVLVTQTSRITEIPSTLDTRELRHMFRKMSRAFRDSKGGGLVERSEEISKLLFAKLFAENFPLEMPQSEENPFVPTDRETDDEVYERASALYHRATRMYAKTFAKNHQDLSDDRRAVVVVVKLLRGVALSEIDVDVKGVAYEELLKNSFDKTENQQFFTPRPVVDFMVEIANPTPGMKICDPACGTGGFLVGILLKLKKSAERRLPYLVGIEIDRRMAWIAQMNLLMHGAKEGSIFYLPDGGALSFAELTMSVFQDNGFDLILTNPPFGSDYADRSQLVHYETGKGRASRRRGVLFIERSLKALKPRGLLCIIIEDSVLNSEANADIRDYILRNGDIEAIISLPDVTFMPYSTAKASIVLVRKKEIAGLLASQGDVFMAQVKHVGRRPNGDPEYSTERDEDGRAILLSDLPRVAQRWRDYQRGGVVKCPSSENIFICPQKLILECANAPTMNRLDTLFHHSIRYEAEKTLRKSKYPTPKLSQMVTDWRVQVIPSITMPDDLCRYIGLANIASLTGEYYVSEVMGDRIKSSTRLFQGGDILFSKLRPELRKCCLIDEDAEEGVASSECLVLRPIRGDAEELLAVTKKTKGLLRVLPEYLAFMLRSDLVFGQLVYQITGVGRPRVSRSTVLNVRIPLPPMHLQKRLADDFKRAYHVYQECRERAELANQEADHSLENAYRSATEVLCPD